MSSNKLCVCVCELERLGGQEKQQGEGLGLGCVGSRTARSEQNWWTEPVAPTHGKTQALRLPSAWC